MEVCGETFKVYCGSLKCDCVIKDLRLCILEKLKLNSGTGLIIIKANIELSKKEIKKSSQKLFQKHYCLDDHTVIGDCGFLLLKDVKCISI